MTTDEITDCVAEIRKAVKRARRRVKSKQQGPTNEEETRLAMELVNYREARAIVDAKGYNETGRRLANLVQLLPDKAEGAGGPVRVCSEQSLPIGICTGGGFHRLAVGHYKIRVSAHGYKIFREITGT